MKLEVLLFIDKLINRISKIIIFGKRSKNMKTNLGLVEYCIAQLGKPYWYGASGQIATEKLYEDLKKLHPDKYKADDFEEQYGQKVHDCAGLIEGYINSSSPVSQPSFPLTINTTADKLYRVCCGNDRGDIETMPDIIGTIVFMDGHCGVYIGNSEVIEARGHSWGVVKTKLSQRPWTKWGRLSFINYHFNMTFTQIRKGVKYLPEVYILQNMLKSYGYLGKDGLQLKIDGSFGGNTQYAVKTFQKQHKLKADGIVGVLTWNELLRKPI